MYNKINDFYQILILFNNKTNVYITRLCFERLSKNIQTFIFPSPSYNKIINDILVGIDICIIFSTYYVSFDKY